MIDYFETNFVQRKDMQYKSATQGTMSNDIRMIP